MKYSVIIPVYNAEYSIVECLEGLADQEMLPEEVIIIDNNSNDNGINMARDFAIRHNNIGIKFYEEHKKGPAAARNKGIMNAKGDIIVFTDADCVPRRDWIRNIDEIFRKEDPDVVGGMVDIWQGNNVSGKFQAAYWLLEKGLAEKGVLKEKEDFYRRKTVAPLNMAFKRKKLIDVGLFDDTFEFAGEDVDLWMRSVDEGYKIICWAPNMVVCHKKRESMWAVIRQAFIYESASMRIVKRHFSKKLIIYLPFRKVVFMKSAAFPVYIGNYSLQFAAAIIVMRINLSIFLYLFILASSFYFFVSRRKFRRLGIKINFIENAGVVILLYLRGFAKIIGHIYGSVRNGFIGI